MENKNYCDSDGFCGSHNTAETECLFFKDHPNSRVMPNLCLYKIYSHYSKNMKKIQWVCMNEHARKEAGVK